MATDIKININNVESNNGMQKSKTDGFPLQNKVFTINVQRSSNEKSDKKRYETIEPEDQNEELTKYEFKNKIELGNPDMDDRDLQNDEKSSSSEAKEESKNGEDKETYLDIKVNPNHHANKRYSIFNNPPNLPEGILNPTSSNLNPNQDFINGLSPQNRNPYKRSTFKKRSVLQQQAIKNKIFEVDTKKQDQDGESEYQETELLDRFFNKQMRDEIPLAERAKRIDQRLHQFNDSYKVP